MPQFKEWLSPHHYERRYSRFLENSITAVRKEFLARLQALPWLQESADLALEQTIDWWRTQKQEKRRNYYGYFALINAFNDKQFRAVVKSGTGLTLPDYSKSGVLASPYPELLEYFGETADVFREEVYLPEVQNTWVNTQEIYVDKSVNNLASDLALIIKRGISVGTAVKAVSEILTEKTEKSASQVGRTAKDQVSQVNTELERRRLLSLNLNEYEWITMRDEKVRGNPTGLYPRARPSHFAREGKTFNWNDPPEGGAPGEADGCRCKARPKFRR